MTTSQTLRQLAEKLRRTSMPLADIIPTLQRAADKIDKQLAQIVADNNTILDLRAQNANMRGALEMLAECADRPPEANCSCHISPPCNDCVDYAGLREAFEFAESVLSKKG